MRKAKAITTLAIALLIVSLFSPHGTPIGTARAVQVAPLELDTTQDIQVSNDTSANMSLSWTVPPSPLADGWRTAFFGDSVPPVEPGRVYDMPENRTVHPTMSLAQGVNDSSLLGDIDGNGKVDIKDLVLLAKAYGSTTGDPRWNPACDIGAPYGAIGLSDLVPLALNYGKTRQPPVEISEPVRDPFFLSIAQQEAAWPGFQVNASDAKVVPWGLNNETSVTAEAYAPQVAVSMGTFYRIPSETNDTIDLDAGFVLTQIQYIQDMLESLPYPYNTTYTYNSSVTYYLPAGAQIINAPQLNGLNWTIDWGGGTVMYANLSPSNSTVTVKELWTVTSQNITATEDYLGQAFYQYKEFNIDYTLGNITASANEATSQSDPWTHDYSNTWTLTWGPFEWQPQWSNIQGDLKVTPTLTFNFYIGIGGHRWHTDWFKTYMTVTPAINVYADASVSASASHSWSYTIASIGYSFSYWLGWVWVGGELKLTVTPSLDLSASGSVHATADYKLSKPFTAGVQWVDGSGWSTVPSTPGSNNYHSLTVSGTASISITPSVVNRLELLFYYVTGPFVEITPYAPIVIDYDPFRIPLGTWTIALKLKVVAGVVFLNWNYQTTLWDIQIDSWSGTW